MNKLALIVSIASLLVSVFLGILILGSHHSVGAINGDSTSYQNLILQTYSGATSTIQVGCIQTLATSSGTTIKQVFSTAGATSTFPGTVYWQYGTCP